MDRPLVDPGAVYKFLFLCLSHHVVDPRLWKSVWGFGPRCFSVFLDKQIASFFHIPWWNVQVWAEVLVFYFRLSLSSAPACLHGSTLIRTAIYLPAQLLFCWRLLPPPRLRRRSRGCWFFQGMTVLSSVGWGVAEVLGLFFLFDRLVVLFRNRVVGSFSGPLCFVGLFSCSPTPFCFQFSRLSLQCLWYAVPVGPVYHFLNLLSILAWHLLLFVVLSRALLVRLYRWPAVVVLAVPAVDRLLSHRVWWSAYRRGWCLWPTYIFILSLCLLLALAFVVRTPQFTHRS